MNLSYGVFRFVRGQFGDKVHNLLEQIRESETWKVISDISVWHWIWQVVLPPFVAGAASLLQGVSLYWLIIIFLLALAPSLAISYYWRKHKTLNTPIKRNKKPKTDNRSPWRFVIAPVALLVLIVGHFLPVVAVTGSPIKILSVVTHDDFLQERQEPNGKKPMFNVFYYNDGDRDVDSTASYALFYRYKLPDDWASNRGRYEDENWEILKAHADQFNSANEKLLSKQSKFFTIFQPPNNPPDILQKVATDQGALYVMVSISYHDFLGKHQSDYCGYIWGDPRVFHPCLRHNTS